MSCNIFNVWLFLSISASDNEELHLVQTMDTSAVVDLEYFQIGFEIYLAVACERDPVTGSYDTTSYLFWWSGGFTLMIM